MTAPRIAMPKGKPDAGTVFFVYRAKVDTGSSIHTAGAIRSLDGRKVAAALGTAGMPKDET